MDPEEIRESKKLGRNVLLGELNNVSKLPTIPGCASAAILENGGKLDFYNSYSLARNEIYAVRKVETSMTCRCICNEILIHMRGILSYYCAISLGEIKENNLKITLFFLIFVIS